MKFAYFSIRDAVISVPRKQGYNVFEELRAAKTYIPQSTAGEKRISQGKPFPRDLFPA